jgi:acyl carrier protein
VAAETLTIEPRVRKIIAEHFGPYDHATRREVPLAFEWGDSLRDDLGADSLDEVELCMAMEDEFNIEIQNHEAEGWKTAGDILRTVEGKRHD